jgi:hypothetical protein
MNPTRASPVTPANNSRPTVVFNRPSSVARALVATALISASPSQLLFAPVGGFPARHGAHLANLAKTTSASRAEGIRLLINEIRERVSIFRQCGIDGGHLRETRD